MKAAILTIFIFVFCVLSYTSAQDWVKVEAGTEFSMALKSDGTIWTWGFNGNGQLGDGGNMETEPIQVGSDSDWKDISVGALHSFAVKEDGTLWGWGFNYYGQLGLGSTQQGVSSPQQVGTDTTWQKIDAGAIHSIGLKSDSSIWTFGGNITGQLGHSAGSDVYEPTQVDSHQYIDIAAGGFHNLAIRADRTLWGWGDNEGLQVESKFDTAFVWTPVMIDSSNEWMSVDCGFQFSVAKKVDSTLYTWGFNGNDQLGHSYNTNAVGTPVLVDSVKQWRVVSAGASFMHAILDDGTLWGWGFNGLGQLGIGSSSQISIPTQIGQDTSWEYVTDANGFFDPQSQTVLGLHSLALKNDRTYICASGANYRGQLGNGTTNGTAIYDCSVADISTFIFTPNEFEAVLNIYPNPANYKLMVDYKNAESAWTLELYNANSELQMRQELNSFDVFSGNVTSLPAGVYYVVVKAKGEITGREKVVIVH